VIKFTISVNRKIKVTELKSIFKSLLYEGSVANTYHEERDGNSKYIGIWSTYEQSNIAIKIPLKYEKGKTAIDLIWYKWKTVPEDFIFQPLKKVALYIEKCLKEKGGAR